MAASGTQSFSCSGGAFQLSKGTALEDLNQPTYFSTFILMNYARYLTDFFWATPAESNAEDQSNALALASILATDLPRPEDALQRLIQCFGGSWPPEPTFKSSWPAPLQGYESTYEVIAPLLPVLNSSYNDAENREAINSMRARIAGLLAGSPAYRDANGSKCVVNMQAVQNVLQEAEGGRWPGHTADSTQNALIGFCACISFLRHSFRWGVSPIVREAQAEMVVVFPPQLDIPWKFLQNHFGYTSPGGCMSTYMYFNTHGSDTNFRPYYTPVFGLPDAYQNTDHWSTRLPTDLELKSLPVYRLLASAVASCTSLAPRITADTLKMINTALIPVFREFFDGFNEANIAREIWLPYLQGFMGWGLPGPDGVTINGVSGGQSLAIRTFDAFLGIGPFPLPEIEALHIPMAQREWLNSLRDYNIRKRVEDVISYHRARDDVVQVNEWETVQQELNGLVRQLRLWRMRHMSRIIAYERVDRPERLRMTSGSIPPAGARDRTETMIAHLKKVLSERLAATK